jgi:membrane protein YdbS with pleckstrin-like domain
MSELYNSKNREEKTNFKKEVEKNPDSVVFNPPKGRKIHELPGHTHNPFFAYCLYPDKVKFLNKDPQEKVVLMLRSHPITNLGWIVLSFLMLIAPSFASVLTFIDLLPTDFQIVAYMIWYLMTTAFILERFLIWFFHVNIVTDERILDVDFVSLFFRDMSDANIDQIQDVTVEIGGAVRTFFDFGDVVIQTAAEVPRITFEAIPHPDRVARILRDLRIEEEIEKLEGRVR